MKKRIEFEKDDFKIYVGVVYEIPGMSSRALVDIIDVMPDREFILEAGMHEWNE